MRVLIMAKGERSGPASSPTPEAMAEFMKFNDDLIKAGVVVASGRLTPSAQGKRVRFHGRERIVSDGPFAEAKEVVGGYWLWEVRSLDEAIQWLKRAPFDGATFEVRAVAEEM